MIDTRPPPCPPDVRMNVKVSGRDFPVLTEEIANLPKGPRRTNRLVHLATLGLLWERAVAGWQSASPPGQDVHLPVMAQSAAKAGSPTYRGRLDVDLLTALLDDGEAT